MRKKRIDSRFKNETIYNTRLLFKMINLKSHIATCLKFKMMCTIYGNQCHKYRSVCRFASQYRDSIIYKVRRVFAYYFSVLFSGLVKAAKYNMSKIKIRREKKESLFFINPL